MLFSFGMISRLSIFLSLITYIYFGNYITARKVYIVSSYFGILNLSMVYFWPLALTAVAEGYISVRRVQEFLLMSENKPHAMLDELQLNEETNRKVKSLDKDYKVPNGGGELVTNEHNHLLVASRVVNESTEIKELELVAATASWITGDAGTVGIKDVHLKVKPGELCAVVGQVGAGKSTLLQVILGELNLDSGSMKVHGSMSYASQEAWLFEGSIRSNIVFIEEFDEKRYKDVVKVCALERDFKLLPYGDSTIVGERGISLSGGQKARVNLARAIYKQADIYLLDDPLSAVDTHVGKHIFHECVRRYLQDKICILVTHQLQYLKNVQNLVVMNQARVEIQGTFAELRKMKIESLISSPDESEATEETRKKFEVSFKSSMLIICRINLDDNLLSNVLSASALALLLIDRNRAGR